MAPTSVLGRLASRDSTGVGFSQITPCAIGKLHQYELPSSMGALNLKYTKPRATPWTSSHAYSRLSDNLETLLFPFCPGEHAILESSRQMKKMAEGASASSR